MRQGIHPDYHSVSASCVCGNVVETGSTQAEIKLDICSACHPFFTGTQRLIDTEGRVEKFRKRFESATAAKKPKKGAKQPEQAAAAPAEQKPAEESAPASEA